MDSTGCPDGEGWRRLWGADASAADREAMLRHARDCRRCAAAVGGLPPAGGGEAMTLLASDHVWLSSLRENPRGEETWPETLAPMAEPIFYGRYRVVGELGRGGMGVVYAAEDTALPRRVAIKVVRSLDAPSAEQRARLGREAASLARLESEHVVPLIDVGEQGGALYLVMPLLRGSTLAGFAAGRCPLPFAEVAAIGLGIARALEAAHAQGVFHRDLKPGNVWVEVRDGRPHARLLDFGLASSHAAAGDGLTQDGALLGTIGYMPPEMFKGQPADARADLFSLGVLLYELSSGRRPYPSGNLQAYFDSLNTAGVLRPLASVTGGLPAEFSELVNRLLQRDPRARPTSAREVIRILERLQAAAPAKAPPEDQTEEFVHPVPVRPRRRVLAWSAVAVALCLAVVAVAGRYALTRRSDVDAAGPPPLLAESGATVALRLIDEDLQKQPALKRGTRRYLRLDHLRDRPEEMAEALGAADILGERLGTGKPFQRLDASGTVLAFDLGALGWNDETWGRIRQEDPHGLSLREHPDGKLAARSVVVSELAKCKIPYVRGDWLAVALTRPPLGGKDGTVWPSRAPPAELLRLAQKYSAATLTLDQAAADLGADVAALSKVIGDEKRLREKVGLGQLLRGEMTREEWEGRPAVASRFQEAANALGLGIPSDGE